VSAVGYVETDRGFLFPFGLSPGQSQSQGHFMTDGRSMSMYFMTRCLLTV
jgi:hypothetical protein